MIFPLAPSSLMLGAFWYYTCVRPRFCPRKEANDMEKLRIEMQESQARSPRPLGQQSGRGQVFNKQATTEGTYVTYLPKEAQKGRLV
ncbi:unnamed protein product [Oikopleura dioica]|uniref:Uncharacterized protein n=1 Tax=Oikopleura dioica TaxID=34765 RepID=E4YI22_OIKDI|nr:unnamed protein product [Oikopleura dioica]CBY35829.1 unnamed protein product [Oikopleura dioica]